MNHLPIQRTLEPQTAWSRKSEHKTKTKTLKHCLQSVSRPMHCLEASMHMRQLLNYLPKHWIRKCFCQTMSQLRKDPVNCNRCGLGFFWVSGRCFWSNGKYKCRNCFWFVHGHRYGFRIWSSGHKPHKQTACTAQHELCGPLTQCHHPKPVYQQTQHQSNSQSQRQTQLTNQKQKHRPIKDNAYRQDIFTRICCYTPVELITM